MSNETIESATPAHVVEPPKQKRQVRRESEGGQKAGPGQEKQAESGARQQESGSNRADETGQKAQL